MNLRPSLLIMSLLGLAILSPAAAWAQKPATAPATVIKVSDMHCAACAQKISRKLYAVPGVVQVKTNLKQHAAVITPEKNRQPNPLAVSGIASTASGVSSPAMTMCSYRCSSLSPVNGLPRHR